AAELSVLRGRVPGVRSARLAVDVTLPRRADEAHAADVRVERPDVARAIGARARRRARSRHPREITELVSRRREVTGHLRHVREDVHPRLAVALERRRVHDEAPRSADEDLE